MQKVAIPQESLVCKPDILKDVQSRLGSSQLSEQGFSDKVLLLTGLEGAENCVLGAISVKKIVEEFILTEEAAFDNKVASEFEEIESFLPVGVKAAGLVVHDTKKELEPMTILKKLFKLKATNQIKITYFVIFRGEGEFQIYFISGSTLKQVDLTLDTNGDLTKVVLKDQSLLICSFNLLHAFEQGKSQALISNEELFARSKTILQLPDAEISVFSDALEKQDQSGIQDKFKSYLKELTRGEDPKKKKVDVKLQIVNLKILFPQLSSKSTLNSLSYSVSLEQRSMFENKYEAAAYVSPDKSLTSILQQMLAKLSKSIKITEETQRTNPLFAKTRIGTLVFENELINHAICASVALDSTERNLKVPLHMRFNLPLDRPFFTEALTVLNKKEESKGDSDKLKTVHSYITSYKGIEDGEKAVIYGDYIYYHYGQDGYNDKGWGCAYRSLQTVMSWFLEQKYGKPGVKVPSIDEIQQILVEMGDKEPKFLGSKDWIGAFEVNLVLNKLLDIDSKIMHVTNGANIATHARELLEHFKTEGTPVMIGGGVLAYTLLGVDFNDETGDCNFLILDPHYGGAENPKTIIDKGWCQWKGPKIFLENTFYNFCLPLRPKFI